MSSLIIRRGIIKNAAAEDGPSLEQQFGILANAQVAEKYPKLDRLKLAFQLIDKEDDNSAALGATVYLVGEQVIMVPAFYKSGKIKTGDMMFLCQTQQFLPLSDPWLAWLQDKDLHQPGELVDKDLSLHSNEAMTARELTDPIVKTACVYLKGLTRTAGLFQDYGGMNILDMAVGMGKKASEDLLDQFVGNRNFLNSALRFYSGDEIDVFAKKAVEINEEPEEVAVILPFTKEAKELTPDEQEILERDGYIIKRAAEGDMPNVLRERNLKRSFKKVSRPGKFQLLKLDGEVRQCLVMLKDDLHCNRIEDCDDCERYGRSHTYGKPGNARSAVGQSRLVAFPTKDGSKSVELPADTMMLDDENSKEFDPALLDGYGKPMTVDSVKKVDWDAWVLCPDGHAYQMHNTMTARDGDWTNYDATENMVVSKNPKQTSPIVTSTTIILPQGSRCITDTSDRPVSQADEEKRDAENKGKHSISIVTWPMFSAFIGNYTNKHYRKVKITTDGNEAFVSGDSSDDRPKSIKEASLHLVRDYGVSPDVARSMLIEAGAGSVVDGYKAETYLIQKHASDEGWEDASIGMTKVVNRGPQETKMQMPSIVENPEQLQQAVTIAAENGIKEVFDVTVFKLLARQNHFLEEVHESLPLFMKVLDSLCRKLFLLYWHTDDFEEQYGTVKMKSLEESLKTTIDSLSELTIFFKMRTVDGDSGMGQDGGDLMGGHDIA